MVHSRTLLRLVRPASSDEILDPLGYAAASGPGKPVRKFGAETPAHLPVSVADHGDSTSTEHVQRCEGQAQLIK